MPETHATAVVPSKDATVRCVNCKSGRVPTSIRVKAVSTFNPSSVRLVVTCGTCGVPVSMTTARRLNDTTWDRQKAKTER